MAREWILRHEGEFGEGRALTLSIFAREPSQLVGAIGITYDFKNDRGLLVTG